MKNASAWRATKYVWDKSEWRGSSDKKQVSPSSRLFCDLIARAYSLSVPIYCRGDVLDLGCGLVPLFGVYKDYATKITCVDWPNTLHPCDYLDASVDLTLPLPFADETFDTIILSDVAEHLPNPALLWSEMARLLRDGGHVIMNVPFLYWAHEVPYDYFRYTSYALTHYAQTNGLKVVELNPLGSGIEVWVDLTSKLLRGVRGMGPVGVSVLYHLWRWLRWPCLVKHKASLSTPFALGYFMVATKKKG